jgi:nucleotide sugar dehydrogenase
MPHLVGGLDEASTRLGIELLEGCGATPVGVSCPEISELSKLLENAFLAVGIALAAEITALAHALGVDAAAVTAAAATKASGYHAFHPGAGIGGHCIPNDLELLRSVASGLGVGSPLLDAASAVRDSMPGVAVERLCMLLDERGRSLAGTDVLVVGTGFKPGSADQTATPALALVRELSARGARPAFLDSRNPELVVDGQRIPRVEVEALGVQAMFGAALVLAGDSALDGVTLDQAADVVLDLGGAGALARPHGMPRTL